MMLDTAKVEYVDNTIGFSEWPEYKKQTGVPQVPAIELIKGEYLVETSAIYKLVARKYGFWPSDVRVAFECDFIVESPNEVFIKSIKAMGGTPDEKPMAEHAKEFKEKVLPQFLKKLQVYC